MGLNSKEDKFWLRLDTEHGDFDLEMNTGMKPCLV